MGADIDTGPLNPVSIYTTMIRQLTPVGGNLSSEDTKIVTFVCGLEICHLKDTKIVTVCGLEICRLKNTNIVTFVFGLEICHLKTQKL